MKYYNFIKTREVPKNKRVSRAITHPADLIFDEFYEDMNNNWQEKAIRLQVRRWRKIKQPSLRMLLDSVERRRTTPKKQ